MSEPQQHSASSKSTGSDGGARDITDARRAAATASGRCLIYALFSDLTASPFDSEPAVAGEPIDFDQLALPYATGELESLLLKR